MVQRYVYMHNKRHYKTRISGLAVSAFWNMAELEVNYLYS